MPICGQLAVVGRGERRSIPSACIWSRRAMNSSHVVGDLVARLLERALPVVHRPRVVVEGHEVLVAVRRCRGGLETLAEAGETLPHVADVADHTAVGEGPHAVAGEPRHHVVGLLDVGVEVLLVGVVVDGVDRGRHTGGLDGGSDGLAVDRVGVVAAERHGFGRRLQQAPGARATERRDAGRTESAEEHAGAEGRTGAGEQLAPVELVDRGVRVLRRRR